MENLEKYQKYAERIEIFKGFSPEDVAHVLQGGKVFEFPQGRTIFHEGQTGTALFVILSGKVGLYKRGREIAVLNPGDVFGEMALLTESPRTASAVALTMVRVLTLDEKQITQVLDSRIAVKFLMNVIRMICQRLDKMNMAMSKN
ncbi:MAG: cyclic nucleotide-binding domain-containing protein [Candidatus Hydrogenedentes bacterium]|nr:cyclic nucleotide-binding domain-containing protein [Candidatus Hydrogenedentota bacterium]